MKTQVTSLKTMSSACKPAILLSRRDDETKTRKCGVKCVCVCVCVCVCLSKPLRGHACCRVLAIESSNLHPQCFNASKEELPMLEFVELIEADSSNLFLTNSEPSSQPPLPRSPLCLCHIYIYICIYIYIYLYLFIYLYLYLYLYLYSYLCFVFCCYLCQCLCLC